MTTTEIPYCQPEKAHIVLRKGQGISFSDIATELNEGFRAHNRGCRTGEGVKTWYRGRKVLRQLCFEGSLFDAARDVQIDISNDALAARLTRQIEGEIQDSIRTAVVRTKGRAAL